MSSFYENSGGQVRLIPGAGTYLQDQNKAKSAYDRAKLQLQAQRQQTQIKAGLGSDYNVDAMAQYGGYQQMLQTQGSQLQAANEQAQQRGFFGPGLGNQGESALRYGHAVEALGFKNSLSDYENNYQAQLGDLERQFQAEMLGSLQGAAGDSYGDWTPPGYDDTYTTPTQQTSIGPAVRALVAGPRAAAQAVISPLRASGVLNPTPTNYKVYKPPPMTPAQKKKAAGGGSGSSRAM